MMHRYVLALASLSSLCATAQDSLFHINGTVMVGTVEEIGVSNVRYRAQSGDHAVLVTVERSELARVKLASGQNFEWVRLSLDAKGRAIAATRNHIAIDVLAPALNHATFGYQRVIDQYVSLSVKAGYIGLYERDRHNSAYKAKRGGLIKIGLNLRLPNSFKRMTTLQQLHPLMGWYVRPEIVVSAWQQESYYYNPFGYSYHAYTANYLSGAFLFNVGGQWLLSNRLSFGIYGGAGYGFQLFDGAPAEQGSGFVREPYAYTHLHLGEYTPLVASGGMMVGVLF